MNARELVSLLGGVDELVELTGLTPGRIRQWQNENHIPRSWVKFLGARFPHKVAWDELSLVKQTAEERKLNKEIGAFPTTD